MDVEVNNMTLFGNKDRFDAELIFACRRSGY